ncbi:MAG TPA: ferritin-like domain-containing protein [Blastocatellia bacterium]|nr:ferritin-like domain-containing protein [Blastocatellia bacterium]
MPIAWHAPYEMLRPETRDMARAIHSLMEELEAMDWYSQRVDVTDDEALRQILKHHAEEEKEHAAMLLEWIRRRDPEWDEHLRTYLFTTGDIIGIEEGAQSEELSSKGYAVAPQSPAPAVAAPVEEAAPAEPPHAFTVGSLRPKR